MKQGKGGKREFERIRDILFQEFQLKEIVGESPVFKKALERAKIAAKYDVTVLVTGESGTGKELFARLIHYFSMRASKPFIAVSCSAIPPSLAENELFGHKKGAFTGASNKFKGYFGEAEEGTLFLDEIDSLDLGVQAKLLRFLQEKEYTPLGTGKSVRANVRVVAVTGRDLPHLVEKGLFRKDLFFRVSVVNIYLPALRERGNDIVLLSEHFLEYYSRMYKKEGLKLSLEAKNFLTNYTWPGNVRELKNVMERTVIFSKKSIITSSDIELSYNMANTTSLWRDVPINTFKEEKKRIIETFEIAYLKKVLNITRGNVSAAARIAGTHRRAFWALMKRHNISRQDFL